MSDPRSDHPQQPQPWSGWLSRERACEYVRATQGSLRDGRPVAVETISRWFHRGKNGVTLQHQERHGKVFTRAEWIEAFFAASSANRDRARRQVVERMPPPKRKLQQRHNEAMARAAAAGIL
jgi:hypothetical protein